MNLLYRDFGTRATELMGALAKVYGTAGICYDVKLSSDELAVLRGVVTESWLNAIRQVAPDKVEQFRKLGIDNYHHLSHLLDHARLWTTHTRTLTVEQVDMFIRSFGLFKSIPSGRFQRQESICPCPPMAISDGRGSIGVWCGPGTALISD